MIKNDTTNPFEAQKPTYTAPRVVRMKDMMQGFGECIEGNSAGGHVLCEEGNVTNECNPSGNAAVHCLTLGNTAA